MIPDIVVDVGNTHIKWGRCSAAAVTAVAALPPDDLTAWQEQLGSWGLSARLAWVLTSVHPQRCERLADWLRQRGDAVRVIDSVWQLPLKVLVEHPEKVGIDRLLNAVAANSRRYGPAVIIDAGSAVTVDLVDEEAAFRGGAIMPGLRLAVQALHDHTALLPLIDIPREIPLLPGTSTSSALAAGVFWAVAGGIKALVEEYSMGWEDVQLFLTGGDAPILHEVVDGSVIWPEMTLEGIRLTAEALP
jgi:type III pantothenate kinase